ncbi:flagellar assembly protein FliW [Arthrobacter sp. MYb227]|uniref:flagellar assembly protein FliW n=1 Tax=Arthrobacter sp. MYb227 TaxID=1848601 RepID=UPI000CFB025F|nr:flagellar assembly protein FliW [Arthrobacter sp. MYb227]PQZ96052.1 flagellar assembly protein FliW [Arthrobacter sp. MYb227]
MSRVLVPQAPLLGFPTAVTLSLDPVEGAVGLYSLSSVQVAELRLFVLDAAIHFPDYCPVFTHNQLLLLGTPDESNQSVFVIVNTANNQTTVNLLAPILVNAGTGSCAQVILDGQDWPLRHILPA